MFCKLIAKEFGNTFCWNYIIIPCCPKLYKAKTTQFNCAVLAAQDCPILYQNIANDYRKSATHMKPDLNR